MKTCKTCKYWNQNTFYEYDGAVNDGTCPELNGEIFISLQLGWEGGYVDYIETQGDFGCILHKKKEK